LTVVRSKARCLPRRSLVGAHITLAKTIPAAAGLGGGSSDAAATLRALNHLWSTNLPHDHLASLALELGSDVPYFLTGGTVRATGRGELLEPLPPLTGIWFVVAVPRLLRPLPNKTASLYHALTEQDLEQSRDARLTLEALAQPPATSDQPFGHPFNTFFRTLQRLRPELSAILDAFEAAGAPSIALSGAGPAHYTTLDDQTTAERLAAAIGHRLGSTAEVFVREPVADSFTVSPQWA
jgi:4-diphosphocytidyl-2-C-methyl-D-erythritol kinase